MSELEIRKEEAGNLDKILTAIGKPGMRIAHLITQGAAAVSVAAVIWDAGRNQCLVLGNFSPRRRAKDISFGFFRRHREYLRGHSKPIKRP